METRSNQVLVGSITLGLIAALVVFMIWLSQIGNGGEKTYDIFFTQSVEGLAKGSQVTFSGVPVGQIESINLVPNSPQFVRVRININDDTPILEGSTATIRSRHEGRIQSSADTTLQYLLAGSINRNAL